MGEVHILVVDGDPGIRRSLHATLTARGYLVAAVENGEAALRHVQTWRPALVILEVALPGLSGLDLCRRLDAESSAPILVLSARNEEQIKVRALDLGADDFVAKPFGIEELLARVRALLRRPAPAPAMAEGAMVVGRFEVDLDRRQAWHAGAALDLTRREFDVLAYLLRRAGCVVPHRRLLADIWGPDYVEETQYLRVIVNRLRRKIEREPSRPRTIVTAPGVGYRLLAGAQEDERRPA